ncbi:sucrase ferredoxin [Actinokineospora globicatena]|uniref:Sucrase ferredoxin n=1 Tax=Actinokineospora globicatena TaxID=103729 RepID=A0A9W6VD93_9PSEU|nr:sucrase ferredoxin [Actinokineospora globicatena]
MTTEPTVERCSDGCLRRGDPLGASAPPVRHWLLVEQPGPWGPHPWRDSSLPEDVVAAIAAQASAVHARVLLIRRPGRAQPGLRRWAFVESTPGRERAWWSQVTDPSELTDLGLAEPRGELSTAPIYLVCAHGRHDACCAIRGRPLAAALATVRPEETWECTHVGGDRFAGNMIALPHGLYYGQVPPEKAEQIASRYEVGLLELEHFRGRSTYAAPVQAAQELARSHSGNTRIDSFRPLDAIHSGHEQWLVELEGAKLEVRAVFHRSDSPLTCSATVPAAVRGFELVRWLDKPH